jgi:hypothetical protein
LPLQVQLVDSTYLGLKIFIEKHKYWICTEIFPCHFP